MWMYQLLPGLLRDTGKWILYYKIYNKTYVYNEINNFFVTL